MTQSWMCLYPFLLMANPCILTASLLCLQSLNDCTHTGMLMRRCIAPEILVIQQPAEEINSTSTLDICTCAPKHALIFHLCDLHVSSVANGGQGTTYTYFIRYIDQRVKLCNFNFHM